LEEKRNNEVESLAAFLHSGSEPQKPAPAPKQEEAVRPAPRRSVVSETITTDDKEKSLNDILFSFESKKKEREAAKREPEPDEPVIYGEDEEEEDAPVYEPSAAPAIPDYEEDDGHYSDAATQMMNAVRPAPKADEEYEVSETEDEELTEEEKEERREIGRMKLRYEKQRQHTRTFASILIGALLCAGIVGVSAFFSQYIITYALDLTGIVTNDFRMDVEIPEGADTEMVAAILHENNIISSPKFFTWFGDMTDKGDEYVSGTYTLSSTMTYMTLYSTLQKGTWQEKIVSIRIVEGMTAREVAELLEENCVCFAEDFEKYYSELQDDHDFELMPAGVNKGRALALLALMYDLALDECAAVGDSENDLAMLQAVGYSVAMGNAAQVVKGQADFVTDTNTQEGVAKAILHILEQNKK